MFDWVDSASEKTIEKLFIKLLEDFDTDDLEYATKNNVSLILLTQKHKPKLLNIASSLASNFKNQGHLLTIDNVMKWLEMKRRDFWFKIILDEKKRDWLAKQVYDYRVFLFG